MASTTKVTYVTLSADNGPLQDELDQAIVKAKASLGRTLTLSIGGVARPTRETFASLSPTDMRVEVARAASGTPEDVEDAVAAARAAFPDWRRTPWQTRCQVVSRAAQLIRQRRLELTAFCILEMGKNRVEALGEIEETADLYDYYVEQMQEHDGYVQPMKRLVPTDTNTSVLRPYGVWAVVAPWNFPYALFGAPMAAALLAGNTVVAKPASDTPLAGALLTELFLEAGAPPGTVNFVSGSVSQVGSPLVKHPDVAGITLTGSYAVGFHEVYKRFATLYPRPCIVEMGGKNPAIVLQSADLDRAAQGIFRSAFGMNGHKCSACSRVYVHRSVHEQLLERLVARTEQAKVGDPLARETFLGPLATPRSLEDYRRYVDMAAELPSVRVHTGGQVLVDGAFVHGLFGAPTILTGVPRDHTLIQSELFVPILAVEPVESLDEALTLANDTTFGLTAGLFSEEQAEIDAFLDRIEAGVVYVNRAAGATTGAWPGVQPFGGWKGSGSTGKNIGGLYTLPTYLREQSRTISGR
jgi:1-pyrroline-5-carboxylate dehydrogenase